MSADAHHITAPCPAGLGAMAAMKGALKNVSKKHKVGYINAHATSTPLGDMAEAEAIRTVFKIDGGLDLINSSYFFQEFITAIHIKDNSTLLVNLLTSSHQIIKGRM